jgi:hypothetical protein
MNIKKLDKAFSEYIRRRDADDNGMVKCCTCPTVKYWKEMDCGHWLLRGNLSTRFDERNSHAQCRACNRHLDGQWEKHRDYINKRHGSDAIWQLGLTKVRAAKLMQFEIDELTEYYKNKIKEL